MAYVNLYRDKLRHNYRFLEDLFTEQGASWGVVTKLLCGTEKYLREVLDLGVNELHDSRLLNLRRIKEIKPEAQTVYIKPPAKELIPDLVTYADASLNSEYETIRAISEEATKQGKKHKIIIMIEMGDLREGVMRNHLVDFYDRVFKLPSIQVVGLGTNLNCLYGVMPSEDKLIQLSLYKQIIELKFQRDIPWISAGTSVTLPLMFRKVLPSEVNHFRIGETLYFGNDLVEDAVIDGMAGDTLDFHAQIIEINEKPVVPAGELGVNPSGERFEVNEEDYGKTTHRAILDVGLLDINPDFLIPEDKNVEVAGASSDMLILDVHENDRSYKVGDELTFKLKYMGALSLLNSEYIEKRVV